MKKKAKVRKPVAKKKPPSKTARKTIPKPAKRVSSSSSTSSSKPVASASKTTRAKSSKPAKARSPAVTIRRDLKTTFILGQPSWHVATSDVDLYVTEAGGHVAPVTFNVHGRKVSPLHVAPWAEERVDANTASVIKSLRGDFFCLPFGGNVTPFKGEKHPLHGETANNAWKFEGLEEDANSTALHLSMRTKVRAGAVHKRIRLRRGHCAIYQRHTISGMSGPMSMGHHAMLKFPSHNYSGVVTTSRFAYGQVFPQPLERPENHGYSILRPGGQFDSLTRVPMITGEQTDLSRYPARRGYEDLVLMVADESLPFAWTAVTFPGEHYAWFALKDPRILRSTILWFSNGGRYYAPWNGRHTDVMGLEEVTGYFHSGVNESCSENPLSRRGFSTCTLMNPNREMAVNYIMAVAEIPPGFDRVSNIDSTDGGVILTSGGGRTVFVQLDLAFLKGK